MVYLQHFDNMRLSGLSFTVMEHQTDLPLHKLLLPASCSLQSGHFCPHRTHSSTPPDTGLWVRKSPAGHSTFPRGKVYTGSPETVLSHCCRSLNKIQQLSMLFTNKG